MTQKRTTKSAVKTDPPKKDVRKHIKDQAALAHTYACDGSYSSAARVLRHLANEVTDHAERVTVEMFTMPRGKMPRVKES
jgi:hypothetical protein